MNAKCNAHILFHHFGSFLRFYLQPVKLSALAFVLLLCSFLVTSDAQADLAAISAGNAGDKTLGGFYALAVGVHSERFDSIGQVGEVNVFHGSTNGLYNPGGQRWFQWRSDTPEDVPVSGDHYGESLAAGDFDGDGYYDLAIGIPGDVITETHEFGAVHVLYGLAGGLDAWRSQLWYQGSPGIEGEDPEDGDEFGEALATGDFNGDGFDDLVIGAPREDIEMLGDVGCVHVLYGSIDGLQANLNQVWFQGSLYGLQDEPETSDYFGGALTSGDFNNDGYDDLAIGVSSEDLEGLGLISAGIVQVLYGSGSGLESVGDQVWHQDMLDGTGSGDGHAFGGSLTSADFNADGFDDLAVGAAGTEFSIYHDAGAVHLIYGSSGGLTATGNEFWIQDLTPDDPSESDDWFGGALAAGDFNHDSFTDLAVGAPNESIGTDLSCGAVQLLYGSDGGLTVREGDFFYQSRADIEDNSDYWDWFGFSLAAGDFNWDGYSDLAIGVPGESLEIPTGPLQEHAGAVNVLYGSVNGITGQGDQFLTQEMHDGEPNTGDAFGWSLASLPQTIFKNFFSIIFR